MPELTPLAPLIESRLAPGTSRTLADDVLDGLTRPFKELSPKHLYDARGSELFDQICEQPEYYPTRTEYSILAQRAGEIIAAIGATELVELGSGSSHKARLLLDAMRGAGTLETYVSVDVSESALRDSAAALGDAYPGLVVRGVVGDFERHLDALGPGDGRLVAFLGGTLGNFTPGSRRRFLRELRSLVSPNGALLLGCDLVKDVAVLEAAYNDAAGVTAEFNRNMLAVLNRELGADFDLALFDHVAFFDRARQWIEMRLRASCAHSVYIEEIDLHIDFAAGEEMRTEISAKFTPARLNADLMAAGLELSSLYTDPDELFALALVAPGRP